jgi:regulator of protease activity HflC (stomatin/prohibitin superfamily)
MFDKLIDVLLEIIGYFKFWRVIPINKEGVRLRFGKHPKVLKPGLHLVFPFEIDNVKTCVVEPEWVSTLGLHITTLDNQTISIAPAVKYRIIDTIAWLYKANDAATNLHDTSRLATSQMLTDCTWEECKQKSTWTRIKNKIKDRTSELGIEVLDFGLIDITKSRIIITSINQ